MIKITKTPNADSRTMQGEVTKEMLLDSSMAHIEHVRNGCKFFSDMLIDAGEAHDYTKIEHIDQFYADTQTTKTGAAFKALPWYQLHMQERHHLNDRCPEDVTLIDILERVIDITMAGMARSGVIFDDKIDSEILQRAYKNTIELLKNNIDVIDNA